MQYIICTLKRSDIQNIGPVVGVLGCDITLGKEGDTNKKVGRAGGGLTPETHTLMYIRYYALAGITTLKVGGSAPSPSKLGGLSSPPPPVSPPMLEPLAPGLYHILQKPPQVLYFVYKTY